MQRVELGTMPRPNGGEWLDREMRDLVREEVDVLVSLLEGAEIWEFQLEGWRTVVALPTSNSKDSLFVTSTYPGRCRSSGR